MFHWNLGDRPSLVLFLLNGNRTNSLNFLSSGDTSDELVFLPQNMGTFCVKARKNVGLFLDSSTVINKLLASRSPCGIFLRIVKFLLIEGALKYVWYYMWHCSEMLSTRRFLLVSAVMFVLRRFVDNALINSIVFIPIPFYKQVIKQPWVLPMFTLLKHILLKLTELWLVIPTTLKNPCKILKWILNPMLEYVYVLV